MNEEAAKLLRSRDWRLRNLYYIRDKSGNRVLFKPNEEQEKLFKSLRRRELILKSRQLGITTGYCILWLDTCLFSPNIKVGIIAHTKDDAKVIFREKIKFAYDNLPPDLRAAVGLDKLDTEEIVFGNGSSIRVSVSFRSGTVQILHITEYGIVCAKEPQRAEEIKTGAMQAVPKNGFIIVESTAKGRNGDFYDLVSEAQKGYDPSDPLNWRLTFLPWYEHPDYEVDCRHVKLYEHEMSYILDLQKKIGKTITPNQAAWWAKKYRELGENMYSEYPSCIAGDIYVATAGGFVKIKDVEPDGKYILAKYNKGVRQTFTLTTKNGYEVVCTADHPILCADGEFRHLETLQVGDVVSLQPQNSFGDYQTIRWPLNNFATGEVKIDEDFALFLGLYMGDGSFYKDCVAISCDKQDEDTVAEVTRLMEKFLGGANKRIVGSKLGCAEVRVSNKRYFDSFNALELLRSNSSTSHKRRVHLPWYIMRSPKSVAAAFLRGLFEADGFAARDGYSVVMFTKYHHFAKDIQTLLLAFGVTCRISRHEKKSGGGHPYIGYTVRIPFAGVRVFRKEIGFISKRKQDRMNLHGDAKRNREQDILTSDVIASIEPHSEQEVYDITTSTGQFSAGGIIVHNCPEEAFKQSVEGAYYKRQMLDAWQQGRIMELPIEPGISVDTWWDLGMADSMAICFVQRYGQWIHIVDYYENSGEGLAHYADYLHKWRDKSKVVYSRHVGPHDLAVRELGTGETRLERARQLGIAFDVAPRVNLDDGIESVRNLLPRCRFDAIRCEKLIKALETYRKEWDDRLGRWKDKPFHGPESHGADSFRYGATVFGRMQRMGAPLAREVKKQKWTL